MQRRPRVRARGYLWARPCAGHEACRHARGPNPHMFATSRGLYPLLILIALVPGLLSWWSGHRLARRVNDPALPELLAAHQRRHTAMLVGAMTVIGVVAGIGGVSVTALVMVASMVVTTRPASRRHTRSGAHSMRKRGPSARYVVFFERCSGCSGSGFCGNTARCCRDRGTAGLAHRRCTGHRARILEHPLR